MISKDREYLGFEVRSADEDKMTVEGYAAIFEDSTVLYEFDGIEYKEVIDRKAFEHTDMRDVVLNYNHDGKVMARTRNHTLELEVDNIGLKVRANLSGTEEARKLYEEIKGGYIDKMSFAFAVDSEEYDKVTHTRRITGIKRLYDVAAVSLPAYDNTSISARSFFEAEAEKEQAEVRAEAQKAERCRKLKMKLEVMV